MSGRPRLGAHELRRPALAVYVQDREFENGFDQIGFSVGHTANSVDKPNLAWGLPFKLANYAGQPSLRECRRAILA